MTNSFFKVLIYAALIGLSAGTIPAISSAQQNTAQLQIVTQTSGSTLPPATTVTLNANGASLTGTPSNSNSASYTSNFNNETRAVVFYAGTYNVNVAPVSGFVFHQSYSCAGYFQTVAYGGLPACYITAVPTSSGTGNARLIVYVNVENFRGGNYVPSNFRLTINGNNASSPTFYGSANGTTITLDPGNYSVMPEQKSGYTSRQSGVCSGYINYGQTQTCTVTYSDTGYTGQCNQYYQNNCQYPYQNLPLSCNADVQSAPVGGTVTFRALGGGSAYTWATAWTSYPNIGPALSVSFPTAGLQTVTVTSGSQSAVCNIMIGGTAGYPYQQYGYGQAYPYGAGYVLGVTAPRFPNTGFEPIDWVMLALAFASVIAAGAAIRRIYHYGRYTYTGTGR